MADYNLITFDTTDERKKRQDSAGITIDFTAVRIGSSELTISETTGAFDFNTTALVGATSIAIGASALVISESGGEISVNSNKLTGLATPTAGTDAANKNYVDGVAQGLDVKLSVRAASVQAVSNDSTTPSYDPEGGASTQGQLTFATGPTAIDGVTLAVSDRIVLKNEVGAATFTLTTPGGSGLGASTTTTLKQSAVDFTTSGTGTGLILDVTTDGTPDITVVTVISAGIGYAVSDTVTIGAAVITVATIDTAKSPANCIWVRTSANTWDLAIDFDEDAEVTAGAFTFVEEGTANADSGFVVSSDDPITVGTTGIVWTQFSSAGVVSGGDGIDVAGTVINVDLSTASGLEFATGELQVLANITETSTTESSSILVAAGGLSIAVDDSTLEGSLQGSAGAESLRVKDLGITTAKLAATSVTAAKLGSDVAGDGLTGGNGSAIAALANITETSTTESSSIVVAAGGISIAVDDSTIEGSGAGAAGAESLRVKDLGITTAKLAATSVTAAKLGSDVAGDGLTGGNGSAIAALANITETSTTESSSIVVAAGGISIAVDDSTLEGSGQGVAGAENLRVKAAGITETHLNTSVAGGGLAGGGGTALSVNTGEGIQIISDAVALDSSEPFTNDNAGAITGTGGVPQVVYIKANGNVDLAQANVADLDDFELGLVEDASIAAAASGEITVRRGAIVGGFSGLTPGKKQYVDRTTAGDLAEALTGFVATEHVYSIGRAMSATEILFDPHYEFEF